MRQSKETIKQALSILFTSIPSSKYNRLRLRIRPPPSRLKNLPQPNPFRNTAFILNKHDIIQRIAQYVRPLLISKILGFRQDNRLNSKTPSTRSRSGAQASGNSYALSGSRGLEEQSLSSIIVTYAVDVEFDVDAWFIGVCCVSSSVEVFGADVE